MAGINDVVSNINNLIRSVGAIGSTLSKSFPQLTGTATTATGGSATLPSAPVGFIVITLPSGASAKLPYYNS